MAFRVLLDANVLYPQYLNDALLRLGTVGIYQVRWTEQILDEASSNVKADYPDKSTSIDRRFNNMRAAFPEAPVTGYEALIPCMTNDEKDRHVLAAAIVGRVDLIVTSNVRDFPASSCEPYDIDVQPPDDFLCYQWHLEDPERLAAVLDHWASQLENPPLTLEELLGILAQSAPKFSETVLQFLQSRT